MAREDEHKQLIRREYDECWARGDTDILHETCSGDIVLYGLPTSDQSTGLEGMKQFVTKCRDAFTDLEHAVADMVAEGDRVVVRSKFSGTHDGEMFLDTPAEGTEVEVGATTIYRVENGRVAEVWMCFDTLGLLQQLGAVPNNPQAYNWERLASDGGPDRAG